MDYGRDRNEDGGQGRNIFAFNQAAPSEGRARSNFRGQASFKERNTSSKLAPRLRQWRFIKKKGMNKKKVKNHEKYYKTINIIKC